MMKIKHWEIWLILVVGLVIAAAVFFIPTYCMAEELPPEPEPVAVADNWIYGTIGVGDIDTLDDVVAGDIVCQRKLEDGGYQLLPGGILISEPKAQHFAQVKISYRELRLLYEVDIARWAATLDVYSKQLMSSQDMIEKLTKEKKRSWWERNDFQIGVAVGVIVGVALTGALAVGVYKIIE